jgi:hypothetical protein
MPLSDLKPIMPNDFVWHLSYFGNRDSIIKHGLLTNPKYKSIKEFEKKVIFANNQSFNLDLMWPIPIDVFDNPSLGNAELEKASLYSNYDFWQIDTRLLPDHPWYIDSRLESDQMHYNIQSPNHYIFTTKDIPLNALTLFVYGEPTEEFEYNIEKGVSHAKLTKKGIPELNLVEVYIK